MPALLLNDLVLDQQLLFKDFDFVHVLLYLKLKVNKHLLLRLG